MAKRRSFALALLVALLTSILTPLATAAEAETFDPVVTADALSVRARPTTSSAIVGTLRRGQTFTAAAVVDGQEVLAGNVTWFRLPGGGYVYSAYTAPRGTGRVSTDGMSGRWIEIDRSAQVARAIENGSVVYTAPVTVGVPAFPTPLGSFRIFSRVADETMDSRTIGIPLSSPSGYYLEGVLYTQYFVDGVALHYNYWSPPSAFGSYPGSHGCIGLRLADAKFFWDFARIGTPVIVRA